MAELLELTPEQQRQAIAIIRAESKAIQTGQILQQREESRGRIEAAKLGLAGRKVEARSVRGAEKLRRAQARATTLSTAMTAVDWLKPIVIGGFAILFLVGPGISAIITIIQSMQWYIWIGVIIFSIMLFRNYQSP